MIATFRQLLAREPVPTRVRRRRVRNNGEVQHLLNQAAHNVLVQAAGIAALVGAIAGGAAALAVQLLLR